LENETLIALLGASGFVGSAIRREIHLAGLEVAPLSRRIVDYYNPAALAEVLRGIGADFVINAAGYTGRPNVDACELRKTDCLLGNAVLPGRINDACQRVGIPWGHVSSGCVYTGERPGGGGFREHDPPNFSFRTNNCSFYSGSKALGEEVLADAEECYQWRLRIPFSEHDGARNYLSKVQRYPRLLDVRNSLSHLGDFAKACLACWLKRVPYGVYNLTNPGSITTREVCELISQTVAPGREFDFFADEAEFMAVAAATPRSNCVLDTTKATQAGIGMPPIEDAIERALRTWIPEAALAAV
jgi:dTDP-4-dehydrorhamnose reductase